MGDSYSSKTAIARITARLLEQTATVRAAAAQRLAESLKKDQENNVIYWLGTARHLIRAGRGAELRLWLAMHHLNRLAGGPGWLRYDRATLDRLAGLIGCARITVQQLIKLHGEGLWTHRGDVVKLAGQLRVSDDLVEDRETRCALPVAILAEGLETFQGHIFAAWVALRGSRGVMLVYEDLSDLWGKSRGQLRRWIKAAGVHLTPTRGYLPFPDIDANQLPDPDPDQVGFNHGKMIAYKRQAYWAFGRANTLRCAKDYRTARGGKAIKANRRKTGRAGHFGSLPTTPVGHGQTPGVEPGLDVIAGTRPVSIDALASVAPRRRTRNFRSYKAFRTYNRKHPGRDAFWRIWGGLLRHRPVDLYIYHAPTGEGCL
jgi:hypothetical protein